MSTQRVCDQCGAVMTRPNPYHYTLRGTSVPVVTTMPFEFTRDFCSSGCVVAWATKEVADLASVEMGR
jgi:hypothetical protein